MSENGELLLLTFVFHCIFTLLATPFFIWRYLDTKYPFYLVLVIWIPSMMLYYLNDSRSYQLVLGLIELMLLFLFLLFLWRSKPQRMQQKRDRTPPYRRNF